MSTKIKILWIDDDCENHREDVRNLEGENSNLIIDIIHPTKLFDKKSLKKANYDLFLLDYFLNEMPSSDGSKYPDEGLTIAGKIKEKHPELPVYGVSHQENKGMFGTASQPSKAIFDKIFTFLEIQRKGANILYWDAIDFKKIRKIPKEDVDALLTLLKAPVFSQSRLKQVLPDDLRRGIDTKREGNSIAFARWTQEKLLSIPGFLYNDLQAATHFGMTEEKFREVVQESKLKKAKYIGIFSKTSPTLWWVSELNNFIFSSSKAKKFKFNNTWELAPLIFKIEEGDFSKCAVCNECYPDIVGIDLADATHHAPIHYRCSEPYPAIKRELFFDEIRGFKQAP